MKILVVCREFEADESFISDLRRDQHTVDIYHSIQELLTDVRSNSTKGQTGRYPMNFDVVIATERANEYGIEGKASIWTDYLQDIRWRYPDARIVFLMGRPPEEEFRRKLGDMEVEIKKLRDILEADYCLHTDREEMRQTADNNVSVLLGVSKELECRIKALPEVNVIKNVATTGELLCEANKILPRIAIVSHNLGGEHDLRHLAETISSDVRIVMVDCDEVSSMLRDKLSSAEAGFGIEFLDDLSIDSIESMIQKSSAEPAESPIVGRNHAKCRRPDFMQIAEAGSSAYTGKAYSFDMSAKLQPLKNVVAFCSRAPAGKTTVAFNTAAKLVELGRTVTIIDLSANRSQYAYFKLDIGEAGLKRALEEDIYEPAKSNQKRFKNMYVYTCDPKIEYSITAENVVRIIRAISEKSEYVFLDMPQMLDTAFADAALLSAGLAFLVGDSDSSHTAAIKTDRLHERAADITVILNNYFDEVGIVEQNYKKMFNTERIFHIPNSSRVVYQYMLAGIPASCSHDVKLTQAFVTIADYVENRVMNGER